jgi:hypothetical protein
MIRHNSIKKVILSQFNKEAILEWKNNVIVEGQYFFGDRSCWQYIRLIGNTLYYAPSLGLYNGCVVPRLNNKPEDILTQYEYINQPSKKTIIQICDYIKTEIKRMKIKLKLDHIKEDF